MADQMNLSTVLTEINLSRFEPFTIKSKGFIVM